MEVIIILVGASLLVAIGFLTAFLWAVKDGQFEDKYTPSVRILFDSKKSKNDKSKSDKSKNDNNKETE